MATAVARGPSEPGKSPRTAGSRVRGRRRRGGFVTGGTRSGISARTPRGGEPPSSAVNLAVTTQGPSFWTVSSRRRCQPGERSRATATWSGAKSRSGVAGSTGSPSRRTSTESSAPRRRATRLRRSAWIQVRRLADRSFAGVSSRWSGTFPRGSAGTSRQLSPSTGTSPAAGAAGPACPTDRGPARSQRSIVASRARRTAAAARSPRSRSASRSTRSISAATRGGALRRIPSIAASTSPGSAAVTASRASRASRTYERGLAGSRAIAATSARHQSSKQGPTVASPAVAGNGGAARARHASRRSFLIAAISGGMRGGRPGAPCPRSTSGSRGPRRGRSVPARPGRPAGGRPPGCRG